MSINRATAISIPLLDTTSIGCEEPVKLKLINSLLNYATAFRYFTETSVIVSVTFLLYLN